ncbi:MAG: transcriptional repressor [Calditrichaeota bacterium]|nr:transcriptional repressor [Calditrichota bacterium]
MKKDLKRKMNMQGYKLTQQRKMVLDAFKNRTDHYTAWEIYEILRKKRTNISLATVYRSLDILTEMGFLNRVDIQDSPSRYEFVGEDGSAKGHHHHLICIGCGKVIDFEPDLMPVIQKLQVDLQKKFSFVITNHHIRFEGYCEECAKKLKLNS